MGALMDNDISLYVLLLAGAIVLPFWAWPPSGVMLVGFTVVEYFDIGPDLGEVAGITFKYADLVVVQL